LFRSLNDDNATAEARRGTRQTLIRVLENILRLIHPIMPFITEAIWQKVAALAAVDGDTIMLQPYPAADDQKIDQDATNTMQWVMDVITGIRNIRGEMDISPAKKIPALFQDGSKQDQQYLNDYRNYLMVLAKLDDITWLNKGNDAPEAATTLVGHMKVLVPLGGLIDKKAEQQRLQKEIEKNRKELQKAKGKLSNEKFIGKAPENIVNQEKERVANFESAIADLNGQLEKILALPD
ncbi:MAG TPA: valine--tRNA ligase, partial [Acidiferrobacteraceae bacterium]|nr:valine--tRNA ligase [Acidiferrobacteraceae bacterium]HEX20643.1 valine--tRNA ligase [Acidiferrobacteraceae bacterium]